MLGNRASVCQRPECDRKASVLSIYCEPCELRFSGRHARAEEREVELEVMEEDRRRLLVARMAVSGEWTAIARQLARWGIET